MADKTDSTEAPAEDGGDTVDPIIGLTQALSDATEHLRSIRAMLSADMHDLREAIGGLADLEGPIQATLESVHAFCDAVSGATEEAAGQVLGDYEEGFLGFLQTGSHALAEQLTQHVDDELKRLDEFIKEEVDKNVDSEIAQLRSVLHEACASTVAQIDEGAEEMTAEIASFRPVLKMLEANVKPALDALDHVKDLAHAVGM